MSARAGLQSSQEEMRSEKKVEGTGEERASAPFNPKILNR